MTKHTPRALTVRTLALAAVATALAVGGCAAGGDPATDATATTQESTASAPEGAEAQPNADDEMFAAMMIPHHQQAIAMADLVLGKPDVDERVLDLAQRIKDAQGPEIEQLQGWLDEWGMHGGHGGDDHMDGMMSAEDMQQLEAADGPEASRLFLEQMIVHHEGAVQMARSEVEHGQHAGAVAMAEAIIDAQEAEIAEMRQLLTEL